mmetsp:Transcript_42587/g.120476  ORF Transcript_42587/g.120476 Transcript_42587/m.120476 type:complete len:232 (-) Transcript_42587:603-1298(-)
MPARSIPPKPMKEPSMFIWASRWACLVGTSTLASSLSAAARSASWIFSNLPMSPSMAEPPSLPNLFRLSSARSLYCACRRCSLISSPPVLWKTFRRQVSSSSAPSKPRFDAASVPVSSGVSLATSLSCILILRGPTTSRLPLFRGPTHWSLIANPSRVVPSSEVSMSQTKNRSCSDMILQWARASLSGGSSRQSASRSAQLRPMIAPVDSTRRVHALFPQGGGFRCCSSLM